MELPAQEYGDEIEAMKEKLIEDFIKGNKKGD